MDPARRRLLLASLAIGVPGGLAAPFIRPARAARPFTLVTNWYAQPDQGGFYQAEATGLYRAAGLDVVIRSGSPQLNITQLLMTGEVDAIIGFDTQVLTQVAQGIPVVTVAAMFQYDLEGLLAHDDVARIEDLRNHQLMISSNSLAGFWPWLKHRFGFTDDQMRPYTDNLQPFMLDRSVAIQAIATAEPCTLGRAGTRFRFFPFHQYGYPTYSCTVVTRRDVAERDPSRLRAFLEASILGYRDYLGPDPSAGNALIRRDNPQLDEKLMDCAIATLRSMRVCSGGDAAHGGVGIMTEARWQATYEFMLGFGLVPRQTEWRRAFSLDYLPTRPLLL